MTATTTERPRTEFAGLLPQKGTHPIAAEVVIRKGWQVALDANGRLVPAGAIADTGALFAVGAALMSYDNTTGAAGAKDIEVEYGVVAWDSAGAGDAIAADDVGKACYMLDNQTVALTDGTGARGPAGIISEVRNGQVYVWEGPHVGGLLAHIAALTAV